MDPSDRLRHDHERLNRMREYQAQDRHWFRASGRAQIRIDDLNRRIAEAERQQRLDEALAEMSARWPNTRTAIEQCTAVTPALRQAWLDRLDSIRSTGHRSAPGQLEALASEVNGLADALGQIAEDLERAAERRKPNPLTGLLPWLPGEAMHARPSPSLLDRLHRDLPAEELPPPGPMFSRWRPSPFDLPRFDRLAQDLRPIQDRILALGSIPMNLSVDWLSQLAQIDLPSRIASGASGEKARHLAGEIAAVQANLRSVGAAASYQATTCRWYWNV
jgi:hypothetical protein